MGGQGNSLRVHAKARAPLKKRKLSLEMYDADGEPYTVGRGKTPITKPNGTECQIDYDVDSLAKVVAKNFSLDDKGMIPSDVLLQVKLKRNNSQSLGVAPTGCTLCWERNQVYVTVFAKPREDLERLTC
jgi:hypothetical protein